ncbi:MAG TPA: class I SAM-dependent methyltransferase [Pyrinomonadaceae bacterium]|nr:class I SAM-dependent methyltransferase [Pyrinomonadaceae bacterium]
MQEQEIRNSYEIYAAADRAEMLGFVPADAGTVLDVGCGVGHFGALLKAQREREVWGVELDPEAAAIALTKLDRVISGAFNPQSDLPRRTFDCVVFNDVLEHMVDPYGALRFASELLTRNGKVVASIPNVRYFGNMWLLVRHKSWKYEDSGILDRTHLRFFTESSIREMFTDAGYVIDMMEGINPLETIDNYFVSKFRVLNFLSLNSFADMRWLQFAVVASHPDSHAR